MPKHTKTAHQRTTSAGSCKSFSSRGNRWSMCFSTSVRALFCIINNHLNATSPIPFRVDTITANKRSSVVGIYSGVHANTLALSYLSAASLVLT